MADTTSLQALMHHSLQRYSAEHRLSPRQWQVCRHVLDCRTPALGGLALQCDHCQVRQPQYHACRDRHCPRCQRRASQAWCARQRAALLPVTYYHLVFTLPHTLNPWVELHARRLYALLFETVWATVCAFGSDPKRLGGQMGMSAVLHTWGENLSRHVHLHCLVPGGAWSDTGRWRRARSTYLFPVRALSRHFRGGFVSRLRQAIDAGQFARITDTAQVETVLRTLMDTHWVVYAKPCLTHTETVLEYLGRYSHRVALSDSRLSRHGNEHVALRYKDYRDGARHKLMTRSAHELIRRFLLHVLPKHFVRIRHYGLLANRSRGVLLETARRLIAETQQPSSDFKESPSTVETADSSFERSCPRCGKRSFVIIDQLTAVDLARFLPELVDTS